MLLVFSCLAGLLYKLGPLYLRSEALGIRQNQHLAFVVDERYDLLIANILSFVRIYRTLWHLYANAVIQTGETLFRDDGLPDLNLLTTFATVADSGSFARAAERLYTSKSVIKKRIDDLEAWTGGPLFERGTRGVSLLPHGRVFLSRAQKVLTDLEQARADCFGQSHQIHRRTLRVVFYSDFLFPSVQRFCDMYLEKYPDDNLIPVFETFANGLQAVRSGAADVAAYTQPSALEAAGLSFTSLSTTRMCGIVSKANNWSMGPLGIKDLTRCMVATHVGLCSAEDVDGWCRTLSEPLEVMFTSRGPASVQEVCINGGIFLFPQSDCGLFPYPFEGVPLQTPFCNHNGIVTRAQPSSAAVDFIQCAARLVGTAVDPASYELGIDWTERNPYRV